MTQRFRDIRNLHDARVYYEGLAERWPERGPVLEHLCEQVGTVVEAHGRTDLDLTVVELCAGGGQLAYPLLERFETLRYTGIDFSPHGIAYAQEKLAPFAERVSLYEADLNGSAWLDHVPARVGVFMSLQSLHDLGDASHVARIYAKTRAFLADGGCWILADFLRKSLEDPTADPGRLSIEEHLAFFADAGYADARCTMETRNFGCFLAVAGPQH